MARNQVTVSRASLFVTLLLAAVTLWLLPVRYTKLLNYGFRKAFGRVLNVGRAKSPLPIEPTVLHGEMVPRGEYERLWVEYKNTHARLMALLEDYEDIAGIVRGLPKVGPAQVLAEVTHVSLTPMERELIINPTTTTKALQVGQYVIGDGAIVGTISEIYKTTARIRLVSDSKHAIAAGIGRDGRREVIPCQMQGGGDGLGKIFYLSRKEADVRVGDTVYAVARKGHLETAVVIGEVSQVGPDETQPLLWDITVQPVVDPETLEKVTVVVMHPERAEEEQAGKEASS